MMEERMSKLSTDRKSPSDEFQGPRLVCLHMKSSLDVSSKHTGTRRVAIGASETMDLQLIRHYCSAPQKCEQNTKNSTIYLYNQYRAGRKACEGSIVRFKGGRQSRRGED